MPSGNKIKEKIEIDDFLEIIKEYSKEQIECTHHTFFRLSEKQRKIFTCETVKEYLFHETPFLVGVQENRNYAIFYKYKKKKFIRIIADMRNMRKINIVTFYLIEEYQIPRI
tara:strand:+ start:1277 stop:1612 length:336 start_codon:yes stop_codon:yes gene_type:complete